MTDHDLIVETATDVLSASCDPSRVLAAEGDWVPELWGALHELGFDTIAVPESLGGAVGSFACAAAVVRMAARFAAPVPLAEATIAARLAALAGLTLPDGVWSVCSARDDLAIDRVAGGWQLTGMLKEVPWGRNATHVVAMDPKSRVIAALPTDRATITPALNVASEPRDTMAVDALLASDAGVEFPTAWDGRELERMGAALRVSQISGAIERMLELTVEHVGQRKQFGRRLAEFQAVQQQIAALAGVSAGIRMAGDSAAATSAASTIAVAAAKTYASAASGAAVDIAHQLHGAIGVTHEHQLHLFSRRVWAWRDEFGSEASWAETLSHEVMSDDADALWSRLSDSSRETEQPLAR